MCPSDKDQEVHSSLVKDDCSSPLLKWPEERDEGAMWLRQVYERWTFSYMDRILEQGSRQALKGGSNLKQDDLFPVPTTMTSSYLIGKFR
jgi:hypothetical protein